MYPVDGSGMKNIKFYSKLGAVWCSGYMETDELSKAVNAYIDSKFTTRMPILTAKGIYKSAHLDDPEKGKVSIYLEKCEVIKVTG